MSGRTVVIGGGNVAIDAARVALRCGADAVTMVCLEPRDGMPASAEEIAEAEEEGTTIRCGYGPKEFVTENGHVTAVVLKKCTGLYNPEGRFAPTYDENDTITLPCDNVVLSIGQCIEWGDLLNGEAVELGRGQGAVADPVTYQTAQPDVFVGGDVYTGPRFAIDAIAAGKQGAISIHRFVQPNTSMTIGRNRREFFELDKDNLSIGEYDHTPRQHGRRRRAHRRASFLPGCAPDADRRAGQGPRPPAAWAAAPASWTPTSASAAASAPPSASLTPSTCTATCPSAARW